MSFESSKTLAGIGALLLFIGGLPFISGSTYFILPIIGVILLLVGLKGLSNHFREPGIFNNSLYATIIAVVGAISLIVVAIAVLFTQVGSFLGEIFPAWDGNWTSLSQVNPVEMNPDFAFSGLASFFATILLLFVGLFVIVLLACIFYRKSLSLLREKSNVGLFGSAGTVLLIGGVLTILFGLGLILIWVTTLIVAIAFFQLKDPYLQAPPQGQYVSQQPYPEPVN